MKYLLRLSVVVIVIGCTTTSFERVSVESSYEQAEGLFVHTDEEIGALTKESFKEGISYGVWLVAEMCTNQGEFQIRGRVYSCEVIGQTF